MQNFNELFDYHNRSVTIGFILDLSNKHIDKVRIKDKVKQNIINEIKNIKIQGYYCFNNNITRNLGEVIGAVSNYETKPKLDKQILADVYNTEDEDKLLLIFTDQQEQSSGFYDKINKLNDQKGLGIKIHYLNVLEDSSALNNLLKKYYE